MTHRLALVGDRSPHVRAHVRIPELLTALRDRDQLELDAYWIPTEQVDPATLAAFDGIWVVPGSPYRSQAGAVTAVHTARTGGIPFLGTCGGCQHAILEYARNVCGLSDAEHAEYTPDAATRPSAHPPGQPVIAPLACSLVGHEAAVNLAAGSLAERVLGAERSVERYHCAYGLNPDFRDVLSRHGLRFSGHDDDGEVRAAELPDHPFFLATLFQPELAEHTSRPHRIIRAFAAAVAGNYEASRWPRVLST